MRHTRTNSIFFCFTVGMVSGTTMIIPQWKRHFWIVRRSWAQPGEAELKICALWFWYMIMMWSGSVPLRYHFLNHNRWLRSRSTQHTSLSKSTCIYQLSLWHLTLGIGGVNDNGAIPTIFSHSPCNGVCLRVDTPPLPLHILRLRWQSLCDATGVLVPLCWHWYAGWLRIRIHVFASALKNQFCDTLSMFNVIFIVIIAGH